MANSFLNIPGLPLGLRNNNPGNLRPLPGGQKWTGEISPDLVNNFSRFEDVAYGLRAMITDLTGDIVMDGLDTVRKLVTQYAPPSENNTIAYINSVANYMGINPDSKLTANRQTLEKLIRAKLQVELGANRAAMITQADINQGFARLGSQALDWLKMAVKSNPSSTLFIVAFFALLVWKWPK